jgi:hypothetical protein
LVAVTGALVWGEVGLEVEVEVVGEVVGAVVALGVGTLHVCMGSSANDDAETARPVARIEAKSARRICVAEWVQSKDALSRVNVQ